MPNGVGSEKGKTKNIKSNQQKKQLCTCSTLFCTFLCHCCRNVKFTSYTFYGENVVCAHKKFCCLCSCSLFFHFHLAGLAFSFFHRRCKIFMLLFFQRSLSPLFFISRFNSLSLFFSLSFASLSYFFVFSVIFFFYFSKLWKYMITNLGLIL